MAKILLIVYDNGSRIPFFPQGIAYIAAQAMKDGHDVEIFGQDISHSGDEKITRCLNINHYDVVGLGFCAGYYQYRKCKSIAESVNKSVNRKHFKFVLGGHGPAGSPNFFLKKFEADYIVHGPGEFFMQSTNDDHPDPLKKCRVFENADEYEWPAYSKFPVDIYKRISWPTSKPKDFCMPVLSGRGCPYKCTFCYRMDEGFKKRSAKAVIEEMEFLWKLYGINHFQFSDELLMSSVGRTVSFCEAILRSKLFQECKNLKWDCNGRLNFAVPEVLKIMKKAGCEYINYGIEALDNNVLEKMNKKLTVGKITCGVEATLNADISPGLNILWGNIGDTAYTLDAGFRFLVKYDQCDELRTIRPVTPYPGTELYKYAVENGLIKDAEDFYENKHKNSDLFTCMLMDMDMKDAHLKLGYSNQWLYKNYLRVKSSDMHKKTAEFYANGGEFRGFREV